MLKKIIKFFLPNFILDYIREYLTKRDLNKFKNLSMQEVFNKIYNEKIWTPVKDKNNFDFFSGIGTHDSEFTEIYIKKLNNFLLSFKKKQNVVDLGCGDFSFSSRIRINCANYIAADVCEPLIERNKIKFKDIDVDFRTLDITKDNLPSGDICILRQVLQHLSNESIKNFLNLIKNKYKYLIITEHLPDLKNFKSNVDMPTSFSIRLAKKSGVVLTDPPFNLKVMSQINLCNLYSKKIVNFEGVINTKVLRLF